MLMVQTLLTTIKVLQRKKKKQILLFYSFFAWATKMFPVVRHHWAFMLFQIYALSFSEGNIATINL